MREAGLRGFWSGYFAARAPPLGPVGAGTVAAAFYNFHPDMVRRAVPACWEVVSPDALCTLRATAAAAALAEICRVESRSALVAALPLLRRAVAACDTAGRVMAAANADLWPAVAADVGPVGLAEAWQTCTALREHRGDGHVAALLCHDVDGLSAHVLAAGTKGIPADVLRDNRGFSEASWAAAQASLAGRGLVHADGRATDTGRTLHATIEALTDELAEPPWARIGDNALADLFGALSDCARDVAASGLVPYPNPMGLPSA